MGPFLLALVLAGAQEVTPVNPDARVPAAADAIDRVVEATIAADRLPGLALVVARGGAILVQAAWGLADVEPALPATTRTLFPIASATKSFTSTAVFLLVREGKFSLDDSITELLDDLPESWLEVTPRHLLSHISGLPDVSEETAGEAGTGAKALEMVRARPLEFPVGTNWSYNQTNYLLLQMLVERYGERPFETFVRERLFTPLGLEATAFGDCDDPVPGRATMYDTHGEAPVPRSMRYPDFLRGAAGLNTSVEDWYRWADAWAHARILPREDLETLWAPAELASGRPVSLSTDTSYGCGVQLGTRSGQRSAGHSGGGCAAFRYFIDEDMLIVFATNGTLQEDAFVERIARAVRESDDGR